MSNLHKKEVTNTQQTNHVCYCTLYGCMNRNIPENVDCHCRNDCTLYGCMNRNWNAVLLATAPLSLHPIWMYESKCRSSVPLRQFSKLLPTLVHESKSCLATMYPADTSCILCGCMNRNKERLSQLYVYGVVPYAGA